MTLPLNHSKDRARLIAEYQIALKLERSKDAQELKAILEEEFNTQSLDSGG